MEIQGPAESVKILDSDCLDHIAIPSEAKGKLLPMCPYQKAHSSWLDFFF